MLKKENILQYIKDFSSTTTKCYLEKNSSLLFYWHYRKVADVLITLSSTGFCGKFLLAMRAVCWRLHWSREENLDW